MDIINYKLKMALTEQDAKDAGKPGYNPYALGLMFQAAENVNTPEQFARAFIPTRGMHAVARRMGWALTVEKGHWVLNGARVGD